MPKTTHLAVVELGPIPGLELTIQNSSSCLVLISGLPPKWVSGGLGAETINIFSLHFLFLLFLGEIPKKVSFCSCMIFISEKAIGIDSWIQPKSRAESEDTRFSL